jgi:DNA-directed RNA polymerase specialized sigma24 family protein
LKPHYRDAFILINLDELRAESAAALLHITVDYVRKLAERARREIAESMTEMVGEEAMQEWIKKER